MNTRASMMAIAAATGLTVSAAALAGNQATPNGPWVTPSQNISLSAYESYDQLTKKLMSMEARSGGVLEVESIAVTAGGRDVWLAKIGDPSGTPVLIITQQHGDEPHGTEAMLELIQHLAMAGGPAARIRNELLVLVVPRVNPDGAEFPDRGNGDLDAPPARTSSCLNSAGGIIGSRLNQGRGVFTDRFVFDRNRFHYDINRYHWADWAQSEQIRCNPAFSGRHFDPTTNPVPEAQAIVDAYNTYQPIWVIDVHNQGPSVVDPDAEPVAGEFRPGRLVTGSILWPTNAGVAEAAVNLSKQMTLVMKKRSMQLGNMEITRYVGGDFPGIARNAYGLFGSTRLAAGEPGPLGGSVLVEILGQTEGSVNFNLGQKAIGMLKKNARELILSVLEATADGSLYDENPADVDVLLLENDSNIRNPRNVEEEE